MGLESKFENFRVEDDKSIADICIQNEYVELGELLSNNKILEKLLCIMLRRPRWEALLSVLEAMQSTNDSFTPESSTRTFGALKKNFGKLENSSMKSKLQLFPPKTLNLTTPQITIPQMIPLSKILIKKPPVIPFSYPRCSKGCSNLKESTTRSEYSRTKRWCASLAIRKGKPFMVASSNFRI